MFVSGISDEIETTRETTIAINVDAHRRCGPDHKADIEIEIAKDIDLLVTMIEAEAEVHGGTDRHIMVVHLAEKS